MSACPQNLEEQMALDKFRSRYGDQCEKWDDLYMLRFLRARDLNVEKAKEMLDKTLSWRLTHPCLQIVNTWTPCAEVIECSPYKWVGHDGDGRPVVFMPLGRWNTRKLIEIGLKEEFGQFLYKMLESNLSQIHEARNHVSPNGTAVVCVLDMEELSWWKVACKDVIQILFKFFRELEMYYPEILHSVIVINAHWVFSYVFNLVKPIMHPRTVGKVSVYSKDRKQWEPMLKEKIPKGVIPGEYGGDGEKVF